MFIPKLYFVLISFETRFCGNWKHVYFIAHWERFLNVVVNVCAPMCGK